MLARKSGVCKTAEKGCAAVLAIRGYVMPAWWETCPPCHMTVLPNHFVRRFGYHQVRTFLVVRLELIGHRNLLSLFTEATRIPTWVLCDNARILSLHTHTAYTLRKIVRTYVFCLLFLKVTVRWKVWGMDLKPQSRLYYKMLRNYRLRYQNINIHYILVAIQRHCKSKSMTFFIKY